MKKNIIALFAIATAGVLQAASVTWTIGSVYGPDGENKPATGTYTAYLFVTENTTDVTLTTAAKASVLAALEASDWDAFTNYAAISKTNTNLGIWGGATGLGGDNANEFSTGSFSAFAVILDNTDPSKAGNYLLVNGGDEQTVTIKSSTAAQNILFGHQQSITQGAGNSWVPIPEPTSGLLLLMGMGVLALRRKQK